MIVFIMWYNKARLESLRMRKYFCVFRYGKAGYQALQEETSSLFLQHFAYILSRCPRYMIKLILMEKRSRRIVLLPLISAYLTVVLELISSLHHRMTLMMNI